MAYILKKDIVIPAGTKFDRAPTKTERVGAGHVDAIFGLSKNTFGLAEIKAKVVEYSFDGDVDAEVLEEYFEEI
jgi:hypothetical protein